MATRLEITLDKPEPSLVRVVPKIIQNIEIEELSTEKWSELAIEEMFEAANDALKEITE